MKRIMYNSNIDFSELLMNVNGKHKFRFFIVFFVLSFMTFSCLPVDVVFINSEVCSKVIGSIIGAIIGGYGAKEVSKKIAKNRLSSISSSLEEENIHISEEDLEKAVSSSIDIFEDRVNSFDEVINYFLVLDKNKQIKVLESIKTNLSTGRGKLWEKELYVLEDDEMRKIIIPEGEIDRLMMGEKYDKVKLQRKIK